MADRNPRNTMDSVRGFLGLKRIAIVGVSRDPRDFSRTLFRELAARGYDVVPVNPGAEIVEGRHCFASVRDVEPPVEGALLMTRSSESAGVVRDCAAAGVRSVWLYRGGGTGAVSEDAETAARENELQMVSGECPFMFLEGAGWFHRFHGWLNRVTGSYPN